ncbi:MAG: histone deacetylase [Chloroflexaceae bacterium]|nr:histone deacetylase [Chloroflexaceae bacterium]NJO06721.1 histone deacetylase [Chloroflexaceae bacterium]
MDVFYTDCFVLPLPEGHRFPMSKYARLRERVVATGLVPPERVRVPPAVTDEQIVLVHAADYLERVRMGTLSRQEVRRIGFPWSPALVERSCRSSGATLAACRSALQYGYGVNLAGGTHHAFRDRGEGYCVFNDSVIAARVLQAEGLVERVAIIDCDVHQGNGTAALVRDDPTIFSLSIHGAKNFPFHKEEGDLDIALDDGTGDAAYLEAVEYGVYHALQTIRADLVLYLAGADPFEGDTLGRLAVSKQGLAARDEIVLGYCRAAHIPVAVTMAGGYARNIEDIVSINYQTIALMAALQRPTTGSALPA